MNRSSRPDALDLQLQRSSTSTRARSRSNESVDKPLSSNGSSTHSLTNPFTNVSPEPAYIAASAATGIVTGNHDGFLHNERSPSHASPTIPVTPASLKLINQFLDFLLYSFLSAAKSTSLKALRPAISEVLRSRLAKEAITGADQELSSYLGGDGGDDDFDELYEGLEDSTSWDLDAVWKKARLRCMVYSSLGDIEEDDEEIYSGYGNLEGIVGSQQYEQNSVIPGVVSPAVAIWLTAVLEFMGEQTLLLAGHAAINRFVQRKTATIGNGDHQYDVPSFIERPAVEELDTEKVALNSSLGRLWRQWRKRVRGRGSSFSTSGNHGVLLQLIDHTANQIGNSSTLEGHKNPQVETQGMVGQGAVTIGKEPELNAGEQLKKKTSLTIAGGPSDTIMAPSKFGVGYGYRFFGTADDSLKRRPQSLVLLPSTTTEAPFIISRSSLKQRRSLPTIVRSEFPDPIVEGAPEAENLELESEDTDGEFFTTTEDVPNSAMSGFEIAEPVPKKPDLELICPHTQGQTEEPAAIEEVLEIVDTSQNFKSEVPDTVAEIPQTAPMPNDGALELDFLPQASGGEGGEDLHEGEEDLTNIIGSAHTSDFLVPLPAPRPSSLHEEDDHSGQNLGEESHVGCVPRIVDQQRFERFASRRPAELAEIRTSRVSTFQEQRATDRRPSTTEVFDSDDDSTTGSHKYIEGGKLTPGGTNQTAADYFTHTSSVSSKYSQHSQLSDRKLGQLTLIQPPGSTTSLPAERGNGMRAWTPPQTPNKSQRSSSFGKIQRPVTSHSGTSQNSVLKGLVSSWPMETGKQSKGSDDESRSNVYSEKPSTKVASLDDKEQSFEELFLSGDTIHYTITPDPLRRMEEKETPRTGTSDLADFLRSTGPDGKEVRVAPPSRSGNSSWPSTARAIPIIPKTPSMEGINSLPQSLRPTSATPSATPPATTSVPPSTTISASPSATTSAILSTTPSAPPSATTSTTSPATTSTTSPATSPATTLATPPATTLATPATTSATIPTTTSATIPTTTSAIPSATTSVATPSATPPPIPARVRPRTPAASVPSSLSARSPSTRRAYGSESVSPKVGGIGAILLSPNSITGIPAVLKQNRSGSLGSRPNNRLMARDASGSTTSDSTSELADFFRNTTPPLDIDGQITQRRISRSVAPFRNTMDSDQFEILEAGSELGANEISPNDLTFLTSAALPPDSYQLSSSSTALLRGNSGKQHDYGSVSEYKRKYSRARDPYAIDIDDIDDGEDKKKNDETLIEFLRNVHPPPQPLTPQNSDEMKTVLKKNSSVSLVSRFGRSNRKNSITSNADKSPLPPVLQLPGGHKHTPLIQEDDILSRYIQGGEQRRPPFSSQLDMDSPGTAQSGSRQQARGARIARGDTDTLADFLKFSEPPSAPAQRDHAPKEDTSAMAKFKSLTFSRKSKRNEVF